MGTYAQQFREGEMTDRDDIQKRRRALKDAFPGVYEEVAAILFRRDPMGINLDDNTETKIDEYEPEVDTILPRLADAHDAKDARRTHTRGVCPVVLGGPGRIRRTLLENRR